MFKRMLMLMLTLMIGFAPSSWSAFDPQNDDTDLFLRNPGIPAQRPNVLLVVDNSANWNTAFATEKAALIAVVNGLDERYNVGLAMFPETGGGNSNTEDGLTIRFAIRQMTAANKAALVSMINALDKINDKGNNATPGLAMHEIHQYFNAKPSISTWGKAKGDIAGNTTGNPVAAALTGNALPAGANAATNFNSAVSDVCQKNFVIYISNGPASENNSANAKAEAYLAAAMGRQPTPILITPNGMQSNWMDEYAKYLSTSTVPVVTYTVEVDPGGSGQGPSMTALMKSTAANSGGKYFAVTSSSGGSAIVDALNQIFTEVQSVNSVYASTTLPVSVNVRGTNINQVYIGVFRPDPMRKPRWLGNLKLYKLGFDPATSSIFLADANAQRADNTSSGFISANAQSFWSRTSDYWSFRTPEENGVGGASDAPDGDLVEKGGAAQIAREAFLTSQASRNIYTCTQGGYANCVSGSNLSATPFKVENTDILSANLSLDSTIVQPLTGYETKNVSSIAVNRTVSLNNGSTPIDVTSLSNGGTTRSVTSLSTATPKSIVSLTGVVTGTVNYGISTISKSGSRWIVTLTTTGHGFANGASITVSGTNNANFNGRTYTISNVTSSGFDINPTGNPGAASGGQASGTGTVNSTTAKANVPGHGFVSGQSVTVSGAAPSAFNGTFNITVLDADRFTYSLGTAQGAATTTGFVSGNTTTARVVSNGHGFLNGQLITIDGANPAGYNGSFLIFNVTANTFDYTVASALGPNVGTGVTATRGAGTTVTANTLVPHGFADGQTISIGGATPTGYNGNYVISVTGASSFTYTTATGLPANTSSSVKAFASTIPTVTAQLESHGFTVGENVVVSGVNEAAHNGTFTVLLVPDANTFTYSTGAALPAPSGAPKVRSQTLKAIVRLDAHGWASGDAVKIAGADPAGYNVSGSITVTGTDTFTIPVAAALADNTASTVTASRETTTATAYSPNHGFTNGASVTISGATPAQFNGTFTVSVPNVDTFTYTIATRRGDATGTIVASASGASSTERTNLINWIRGQDNLQDENANGSNTDVRSTLHGDVLHSRPAVVNYNRRQADTANIDNDVYIFYGTNDGIFRAVKGGYGSSTGDPAPGTEVWGFIPQEFFPNLRRLRDNAPKLSSTYKKPYFADGPIGVYVKDGNGDNQFLASEATDKVNLYIAMRRGGRLIYALNVLDPLNPKFMWKKTENDPGMSELGQTWSEPRVISDSNVLPGQPILMFGAGYDDSVEDLVNSNITAVTANSVTTAAGTFNRSMGRGVYVLNGTNGNVIWQAAGRARSGSDTSTHPYLVVPGMDCSIPSDITVSKNDGNAIFNRAYFGDTCGNVWRLDFNDANPANWKVIKLAALGNMSTASGRRKIMQAIDVVRRPGYEAILVGTGDREHPFDTTVTNRFYMLKDYATGALATDAVTGTQLYPTITESDLYDVTNNCVQVEAACTSGVTSANAAAGIANAKGWYLTMGTGEKVVGESVAVAGTVFFNTNQPQTVAQPGVCTSSLGTARQYAVSVDDASATLDLSVGGGLATEDRTKIYAGGGYLPSPVPVMVKIETASGDVTVSGIISGTTPMLPPGAALNARVRRFWYKEME